MRLQNSAQFSHRDRKRQGQRVRAVRRLDAPLLGIILRFEQQLTTTVLVLERRQLSCQLAIVRDLRAVLQVLAHVAPHTGTQVVVLTIGKPDA